MLNRVTQGWIASFSVGNLLEVSRWLARKVRKNWQAEGPAAIRHNAHSGRTNNWIGSAMREFTVKIAHETSIHFGLKSAAYMLAKDQGLEVLRETLRKCPLMQSV